MKSKPPLAPRNPLPTIDYPPELPVSQRADELCEAIAKYPVVIVCGATGSGKTTQLPKMCLALGRGKEARIGHTQPRRLAAITVAQRIASELKTDCGSVVGYQVRFAEQLQAGAWVKLMTDGVLLAETQRDPDLRAYDTLIIDEAHERSLNIDFLLGYLKQLLARRPDLKVIITSATIDADRFAAHFASVHGPAPIIMVEGRTYPVDIRYAAPDDKLDWTEALCNAVDELDRDAKSHHGSTDMLVFLPGEREIKDAEAALRKYYHMSHVKPDVLPLYSRLSAAEQQKVFSINRSGTRRIVLATNVAETSVTVPGIRYVIDTGTARMKRYSYRNKVEQLLVEPVSQAAANQRAGRCGRVAAGVCLRLYDELDFKRRPAFTDPEILRSSLAAVILRMKSLRLMDIEHFPFIDAPSSKAIADGYAVLQELGGIDDAQSLTPIGKQLAQLPTDPRLGRMVLAGAQMGCLREVLTIVSALSVQDPRERPADKASQADQAHKPFDDEKSEFLSLLKLWAWFEDTRKELSINKTFAACKAKFLNGVRMREWADVHAQLSDMSREMKLPNVAKSNDKPADYKTLHTALLSGLLGNVGFRSADDQLWSGCRGIKFLPHPGVHLSKKPSQWIVAGSLTETTRLYARTVAAIEPPMIEAVAGHLITRSYSDPSWSRKQAQTTAFERGTLYALPIYHGRRVAYAAINPEMARETMIRGALVAQDYDCSLPFFIANGKLIKEIEKLEHKSRRPDLMVDEELLFAFYDAQIPADVVNGAAFEAWWKAESKANPRLLFLSKDDLLKREAAGITVDSYPKHLRFMGQDMKLDYRFEVGSPRDGATLTVPLVALNQVDAQACEWLVPGMLKDKVAHLLKSLPPRVRHRCQPVADNAALFAEWSDEGDEKIRKTGKVPLIEALLEFVRNLVNVPVKFDDFKLDMLPAHCFMNYQVVDEHGRMLDVSRSLATLKAQLGAQAQAQFVQAARASSQSAVVPPLQRERAGVRVLEGSQSNLSTAVTTQVTAPDRMTTWMLTDWPELMEVQRKGQTLVGFPALQDAGDAVTLEIFDDEQIAKDIHRAGIRRLLSLQIKEPLKALEKTLKTLQTTAAQATACKLPITSAEGLIQTVMNAALDSIIAGCEPPKTAKDFDAIVAQGRAKTSLLAQEWARRVQAIVIEAAAAYKKLGTIKTHAASHANMLGQYERLFHKHFLDESFERLGHYPRYLQAMALRGDKLRADPARDTRLMNELAPLWTQYTRAKAARKGQADEALDSIRWLLEELHVGLFAQELKTPSPVSVKRVSKAFEGLER
jgi:ATP-dependent helicase HrpA